MAKLTIREGDRSTVYEILDDVISIGRKDGVAVRVQDPHVGSEHCQIRSVPGVGYKLIDLESRNGTKVNGQFVNQHVLADGDEITLSAVVITFAGAAPTPAAARPAAAPAARPATARPATARPATARPATARPAAASPGRASPVGMSPRDREMRPRSTRNASNAPIIVLGVIVGLLLFMVLAWVTIRPWFEHSKNQNLHYAMTQLRSDGKYEQALKIAKQADPTENEGYFDKIQKLIPEIKADIRGRDLNNAGDQAWREFSAIESWIGKHRDDTSGIAAKWEAYIAKYKNTFWGGQAQLRLDELFGTGAIAGGSTSPEFDTGGQSKIDRAFRLALAAAKVHEKRDAFGPARDEIEDFWDENQLLAEDPEAWRERKEGAVRGIEERAQDRWEEIDGKAKAYVDAGEYDKAINLYKEVRKTFGLEKYQTLAKLAMQHLTDEGE